MKYIRSIAFAYGVTVCFVVLLETSTLYGKIPMLFINMKKKIIQYSSLPATSDFKSV